MSNHDHDSTQQPQPTIATTATFGVPTVDEFQRVIAYVNEQVSNHLAHDHGMSQDEILSPSPELVEKMTKECGVVEIWAKAAPFLLGLMHQLKMQPLLESLRATSKSGAVAGGPLLLGKIGQA